MIVGFDVINGDPATMSSADERPAIGCLVVERDDDLRGGDGNDGLDYEPGTGNDILLWWSERSQDGRPGPTASTGEWVE